MSEIKELIFIDTETSGLDETRCEIIEIALIRLDARTLKQLGMFETKVKPKLPVPEETRAINKYSPEEWADAPFFEKIIPSLRHLLEDATPAGQNPSFDLRFLRADYARANVAMPPMDYHQIDVAMLAWPLVLAGRIEGMGLKHTRKFFGREGEQTHRAMGDILDTIEVYTRLIEPLTEAARKIEGGQ